MHKRPVIMNDLLLQIYFTTTTINLSGRQLSKQNHHCFADKLTIKTWVSHLVSTDAQKYPS